VLNFDLVDVMDVSFLEGGMWEERTAGVEQIVRLTAWFLAALAASLRTAGAVIARFSMLYLTFYVKMFGSPVVELLECFLVM